MPDSARRYEFLDGLRGWAAVAVLFYHVFIDGLPANALMEDRAMWARVFFLNGTLAVCVFFVVSGFSLSIRYLDTGDARGLVRIAAGRYVRLVIPVFAICAITYLLMITGVIGPAELRPAPLGNYLQFTPSLEGLLTFSLLSVFFDYTDAATYNPPLWTMSYEFFGSFLVFGILALVRGWPLRMWVFALTFIVLTAWQSFYALFIGGIIVAEVYRHVEGSNGLARIGVALCAGGIVLSLFLNLWFGMHYILCATALTAGVAFFPPARRLFENRLARFLGWISFPLYLVQAAVIYAFSVRGLDVVSALGWEASTQRWIVGAATIPVAFVCAMAFSPINDAAVTLSRKTGAWFTARLSAGAKQPAPRPVA